MCDILKQHHFGCHVANRLGRQEYEPKKVILVTEARTIAMAVEEENWLALCDTVVESKRSADQPDVRC